MSYDPKQHNSEIEAEQDSVAKQAAICRAVQETIESQGWKNTIGPILDKMIIDTVGGKIGDVWVSGLLDRAKKDERREFYVGYKQALMDLHKRVMFHVQQLPLLEDKMKSLEQDKQERYRIPLVDDTRYSPEG